MNERILVPYDGSASADQAVEKAMTLAREQRTDLYILGMAPDIAELKPSALPIGTRLMDDLVTFAHLGTRLGIDIDGTYLEAPTELLLRSIIETHHISQVIMARGENVDANTTNGRLLQALTANCPVPVKVLTRGNRDE